MAKTVDEQLRKMRLTHHKKMRSQNEQSQGTVGQKADGQRQEEPGRVESVVEQVRLDGPEHSGVGSGVEEPVQEDPEAAPEVAPKKRGRPKKRG